MRLPLETERQLREVQAGVRETRVLIVTLPIPNAQKAPIIDMCERLEARLQHVIDCPERQSADLHERLDIAFGQIVAHIESVQAELIENLKGDRPS